MIFKLSVIIRSWALKALAETQWNIPKAAAALDVSEKTLYNWLHKWEAGGYVQRNPDGPGWLRTDKPLDE